MWFAAVIGGLWAFPSLWYSGADPTQAFTWLAERREIPGWQFGSAPVVGDDLAAADDCLRRFLPQWLQRGDYRQEYENWQRTKKGAARGERGAQSLGEQSYKRDGPGE